MAGIIGASQLVQPDIYGSFQEGAADGKQALNNRILAQYSQSALGGDQGALSRIYQADPNAGLKIQQQATAMGEQQKTIGDKDLARLGSHARIVTQAYDGGDKDLAQKLYTTILPEATSIFGQQPPTELNDSILQHLRTIAGAADPQTKKDLINLTPGSTLIDPATGKPVYSQPAAAPNLTPLQTDQGYATFNPKTGEAAPLNYAGGGGFGFQTSITPASPANTGAAAQANALLAKGMAPDAVMQQLVQANPDQQFQLAVDPATGQFKDVSDGSSKIPQGAPTRVMPKPAQGRTGGAPSGYRYQADGQTLEAIPGGPADKSQGMNQGLNDDALHNAAWSDILTGDSGIKGYGKEATAQRAQVANIKAQIAKDSGVTAQELATTKGRNKALQTSLTKLQSQSDMMQKSEKGFQNNMDQALALSAKLDRSGSPVVNKWLLGGRAALGDPDVAALDAAITTASTDYARIMSGQTGAGGTPISTAEEAKSLLRKELSDKSLNAVADVLHKDIMGQQAAVDSQRKTIMDGMQQFGTTPSAGASKGGVDVDGLLSKYGVK